MSASEAEFAKVGVTTVRPYPVPVPGSADSHGGQPALACFSVYHRVLNILVSHVILDQPRIRARFREKKTAGMSQHMRVRPELQSSRDTGPRHDDLDGIHGQRPATFRPEHVRPISIAQEPLDRA